MRFGDRGADGQTAWIVVLDHGDGDLWGEVPHGAPCGIGVDIVVVAHGLAAELLGVGEAVLIERVEIQGSLLVRVLPVTQHMRAIPGAGECRREFGFIQCGRLVGVGLLDGRGFRPMLGSPLVDGGIVRGGVGECLACQPTTLFKGEAFTVFDARGDQRIVTGIGDNRHGGAVLRRTTNHGRSADVDLLDGGRLIRTGTDRIREWIQIHDNQVERLDAELLQLRGMVLVRHIGENAGMDMRVKGLDAAIEALRKTSDLRDLGHLDAKLGKTLRSGTGGNHLGIRLDECLGEHLDAFLMED